MRTRYVQVDGQLIDVTNYQPEATGYVIPDIDPFMSPDGKYITGRSAWRDHLKATDSIEMGHSDLKASQVEWNKKQAAFKARLSNAEADKATQYLGDSVSNDYESARKRSQLNVEMANRLHGRPTPGRKEMIKLTLDIAKRMR